MARYNGRDPSVFTTTEKKKTLYPLYRRARHLDRKWMITYSKPDEFTLLGMIPVFGDTVSTMLAIGYFWRMRNTFALPKEISNKMIKNIGLHAVISILPMIGWLFRRIFGVNKRNYKVLERYVMSEASHSVADSTCARST